MMSSWQICMWMLISWPRIRRLLIDMKLMILRSLSLLCWSNKYPRFIYSSSHIYILSSCVFWLLKHIHYWTKICVGCTWKQPRIQSVGGHSDEYLCCSTRRRGEGCRYQSWYVHIFFYFFFKKEYVVIFLCRERYFGPSNRCYHRKGPRFSNLAFWWC